MEIRITLLGAAELLKKLDKWKNFFQSPRLRTIFEDAKNAALAFARNRVPKKSFLLHSRIEGSVEDFGTNNPKIKIGVFNSNYAKWVEDGTKPHPIRPRLKKYLRWATKGPRGERVAVAPDAPAPEGLTEVFKKIVNHPGTKPQPYIQPAIDYIRPRLLQAIGRALAAEIRGRE